MIHYECDKCGRMLDADDPNRYAVRIEVFAAAAPLEIPPADLARDPTAEIRKLIDQLSRTDADEIEDQTYRRFRFDLCRDCQRRYLAAPMG